MHCAGVKCTCSLTRSLSWARFVTLLTKQNCEHYMFQMRSTLVTMANSSDVSRCAQDSLPPMFKESRLEVFMLQCALQTRIVHEFLGFSTLFLEIGGCRRHGWAPRFRCSFATRSPYPGLFLCCQPISHHVKLNGHLLRLYRVLVLLLPPLLLGPCELFLA